MKIKVKKTSIKQFGETGAKELAQQTETIKGAQGIQHLKRKMRREREERLYQETKNKQRIKKDTPREEDNKNREKAQQKESSGKQTDSSKQNKRSTNREREPEKTKGAKAKGKQSFLYKIKQVFLQNVQGESEGNENRKYKSTLLERIGLYMAVRPVFKYLLIGVLYVLLFTMPVVLFVNVMYQSPFAIFFPAPEGEETVSSVVRTYVTDFREEVNRLVLEHEGHDGGELIYGDYEGTSSSPDNYYDILGVYMVRYGMEEAATIVNEETKGWMKEVVDDMCSYTVSSKEQEEEHILCVNVSLKSYRDMISIYGFTEEQQRMLSFIMSPVNLTQLGYESGGGENTHSHLEQEEIGQILDKISEPLQKEVCRFALQKVGYPYSQDYRDSGNYFDCSSLAFYSWLAAGVNISYEGSTTAASEAKGLVEKDCEVSYEELKPGDLVFWSFCNNGRYRGISHVAVYVGDGMVVEAMNESMGVVYGPLTNVGSIVVICRPE